MYRSDKDSREKSLAKVHSHVNIIFGFKNYVWTLCFLWQTKPELSTLKIEMLRTCLVFCFFFFLFFFYQPTPEPQEEPKELYENLESAPYDDAEPNEYNIPDQDAYEQIDELNKEPDQHVKQEEETYEQVDDAYEQVDDTYEQVASNDTTEPEPVADEELYHNVADPQDTQAPLSVSLALTS